MSREPGFALDIGQAKSPAQSPGAMAIEAVPGPACLRGFWRPSWLCFASPWAVKPLPWCRWQRLFPMRVILARLFLFTRKETGPNRSKEFTQEQVDCQRIWDKLTAMQHPLWISTVVSPEQQSSPIESKPGGPGLPNGRHFHHTTWLAVGGR